MTRPVAVKFLWNGMEKSLWINPGMASEELSATLCAAFGLPDESIQAVYVSDTGRSFDLERICASPSSFGAYQSIHVILNEDDEDEEEEEDGSDRYLADDIDSDASESDSDVNDQSLARGNVSARAIVDNDLAGKFAFEPRDLDDLVTVFKQHAPTGVIDKAAFKRIFSAYLRDRYKGDKVQAGNLLGRLFEVFDQDGNGQVNAREFLSGLTVLAAGDRDARIRFAFNLYDLDQNGYIDLGEMRSYLTSVYTVIREGNPAAFDHHGVSPAQLANVTAEQCFKDADRNHDGRLSFQEFHAWYTSSPSRDQGRLLLPTSQEISLQSTGLMGLSRALHFDKCSSQEVFRVFAGFASEGALDRRRFRAAYLALLSKKQLAIPPVQLKLKQLESQLDRVFEWFDQNKDNRVDFEELGSALSVLCGGTRDEKVRAAFALYDYNNDGYITVDEMINYMTSVFVLLFETSPSVRHSMGSIDPAELAEITARQCFREADSNRDGRLTFEEFRAWYTQSTGTSQAQPQLMAAAAAALPGSLAARNIGLERIRALTGIDKLDVFTVFDQFALRVGDDGGLSWPAFRQSFEAVQQMAGIRLSSAQDIAAFNQITARLFQLFDTDGNGSIDFTELATGLGVLSRNSGNQDDKVRATFSLFDVNGDGFIDIGEMERYLTSVYKVLFEISPNAVVKANGMDPASLARLTTMDCFQEADTDRDGRLSYAEFASWFLSDGPQEPLRPVHNLTFRETQTITGLADIEVDDIFDLFSEAIEPASAGLSRMTFIRAFRQIAPEDADPTRLNLVLNRLFDAFDVDQNGAVSFIELVSGLSILCDGDRDSKAETAFQLFDRNGDGYISLEEMTLYMIAVFRILFVVDASASQRAAGLTADELATATAQNVFQSADVNHDGRLSFEEFREWYLSEAAPAPPPSRPYSSAPRAAHASGVNWMNTEAVRRLTRLEHFTPEEAFEVLADVADKDGQLNRKAFFQAFRHIVATNGGIESEEEGERLRYVLHRLFDAFDQNGNDLVDFSELSSGLSILCGGNQDDKASAAFALYDVNGDGRISMDEMCRYLTCVFKVMYETQPETQAQTGGATPEELAKSTAEKVFMEADLDGNNELDLSEFRRWYSQNTGQQLSLAADLMAADPGWFNADEIRRLTNIDRFDATELYERFAVAAEEGADEDEQAGHHTSSSMYITRESFDEVFQDLIDEERCATEDDFVRLTFIVDRIYDMFDINGDGRVDFSELSTGLTVLCSGSRDEKIDAAFGLFDENGDGYISLAEMRRYLTSVYRVLFSTRPDVKQRLGNTTAEDLAAVTAEQCFREGDTNQDGLLSAEEFKKWVARPSGRALTDIVDATPSFVSIDDIRGLTRIDKFSAEDIRDQIESFANDDGTVDREGFIAAFREIAAESTGAQPQSLSEDRHLQSVLTRLFDVFDTDDNGVVDAKELTAGLSILCGGDRDSKAEVAFAEFDFDGNNRISLHEMTRYLTAVFKVMYEMQPSTAQRVGVPADQLAKITADQIFIEADLDQNGELDFEEFKKWYTGSSEGQALASIQEQVPHWISLPAIRKLTRLERYAPTDVFETFAEQTADGELDRSTFEHAFLKVANGSGEPLSNEERDRLHIVINRLFAAFDVSGNGKVEFTDLVAGLSVLCGGSREIRAEAAFALYDYDGDGAIQEAEMCSYLTSVFRVLFELQPGTRESMGGVGPSALANATTKQIFAECDIDDDGELSFAEFKVWFESAGFPADGTNSSVRTPAAPHAGSQRSFVDEARRLTGLGNINAADVFERFATHADSAGELSLAAFKETFHALITEHSGDLSAADLAKTERLVASLFELFDKNKNGCVDFIELASGLSILCGGSPDEKAAAVFRLYDYNGTGQVSLANMEWYLETVFRLMLETQPESGSRMGGMNAQELARSTAQEIFDEADADKDGFITLSEFTSWFASSSKALAINGMVQQAPSWISLDEIRRITGLGDLSQREVFEEFAQATDAEGSLGPDEFRLVCLKLIDESSLSSEDRARLPLVLERIFKVFDVNNDGRIDFAEMASGISILCNDPRDAKAKAAFALFDENEDGKIDLDELTRYLASVFRLMYSSNPELAASADGLNPEELAEITAEQVFQDVVDEGQDGITFEAFKRWYDEEEGSFPFNNSDVAPPPDPPRHDTIRAVALSDEHVSPDWLSLAEVKRLTGFDSYSAHDLFEVFATFADDEGALDRESFNRAFDSVAKTEDQGEGDQEKLAIIRGRLFDIFDVEGSGHVDFCDISSGLTVLAGGDRETKTAAVFSLFDYNKDGYISFEEMQRYLRSVFSVMFETEPEAARRAGGVSPEDLSQATALHIFSEADLDSDGRLSTSEFSRWFEATASPFGVSEPETNGVSPTLSHAVRSASEKVIHNITIEEARRVTGLGDMAPDDVFHEFAVSANEEGMLDRDAFFATFRKIATEQNPGLGPDEESTLELVLERLYHVFDRNGDHKIDFSELCSGLSVLTKGERESKVRSAFALYDIDGDGYITQDEMQSYLLALFRVLFELMPDTQRRVDVSPEELAQATTEQCFDEADSNKDGRLSFQEFNEWFGASGAAFFPTGPLDTINEGMASSPSTSSTGLVPPESGAAASLSTPMGGLAEIKRLTKLGCLQVSEVLESIQNIAGTEPLNFQAFVSVFEALIEMGGGHESYSDQQAASSVIRQLFSLFDQNGDGSVDGKELASGLSVLCKGSRTDKVKTAFELYDLNGDGFISLEEMVKYLTSVFKVLYAAQPETAKTFGVSADMLGVVTAEQCFLEADTNNDGLLSREEFESWYTRNSPV